MHEGGSALPPKQVVPGHTHTCCQDDRLSCIQQCSQPLRLDCSSLVATQVCVVLVYLQQDIDTPS
jgi:hypothetical protein